MGLGLVGATAVSSIIFSSYMDHFRSQMKLALIAVLTVSMLCTLWLTLTIEQIIPYSKIQVGNFRHWEFYLANDSRICITN